MFLLNWISALLTAWFNDRNSTVASLHSGVSQLCTVCEMYISSLCLIFVLLNKSFDKLSLSNAVSGALDIVNAMVSEVGSYRFVSF